MRRLLPLIRSRLERPSLARWAAAIAILLTLPSLGNGLVLDDHVHRLELTHDPFLPPVSPRPLDLFVFVPRDRAVRQALVERAHGPWWAGEDLLLSFWRPLAAITHAADYELWPRSPAAMHAHNLAWLAALALAAGALFRRLLRPAWIAGLATLLYAVDDAHGLPAGWIANRNALIATTLAILALLAHDRWRRDGWRAGAVLGPAALAAGLFSGEVALAIVAYLVAHAVVLDRGSSRTRLAVLAPYCGVVVVWRIVYVALGYGVRGSGLYVDPLHEPAAFAAALVERAPVLLLGQLGAPPADAWLVLSRDGALGLAVLATFAVLFMAWALWPLLKADATARFLALGLCLSLPPICTIFPSDRMLFVAGIGGSGLVALFLGSLGDGASWRSSRPRSARALAIAWVLLHVLAAPLSLPLRALFPGLLARAMERAARSIPGRSLEERTLVLANAPHYFLGQFIPIVRASLGANTPARTRCLGVSEQPVTMKRLDERTIVLRPRAGYLASPFDHLARSVSRPMPIGHTVDLGDLLIEVSALTRDGRPAVITVHFDVPLDDPSLLWMTWRGRGYAPLRLPAVGQSLTLEGVDPVKLVF